MIAAAIAVAPPEPKLRVLFVDDDAALLAGLRNRLRRQRTRWDMTFAAGGPAAVDLLRSQSFDVVITEMRMPVVDGGALLRLVHRDHPQAIRIVLSGDADLQTIMRVIPIAHRYLTKPSTGEEIELCIERAAQLVLAAHGPEVKRLAGRVQVLPSPPLLYQELRTMLASGTASTQAIAEVVGRDLSVSAKLLQIANSSFFGAARKISSVERAIGYLGFETIQNLVLGAELFRPEPGQPPGVRAAIERAHDFGIRVGRLASRFFTERDRAQEAMLGGMMHDVGVLVMLKVLGTEYEGMATGAPNDPRSREQRESDAFGASHAEVGAHLLELWSLPPVIGEAAAYHHRPAELRHDAFDVVDAVHVAHELVRAVDRGDVNTHAVDLELLRRLGVEDRLPRWCQLAEEARKPPPEDA